MLSGLQREAGREPASMSRASPGFEGARGEPLNCSIWGPSSERLVPVLDSKLWRMAFNYRSVANQISFQINYLCQARKGGSWAAGATCSF